MAPIPFRILTFTTLYPSAVRPRHGIFVETRLSHVRQSSDVDVRVVAPVPWFPSKAAIFGEYGTYARTPREEVREGVRIDHPRFFTLPVIGMYTQPLALARAASGTIRGLLRAGFDFDVIDAHYLYPDGVAAAMLARSFGKPLVLTARGSDVNLLMQHRMPRNMVLGAARQAGAVVAVSSALKARLIEYGVDAARTHVLRNGVDTDVFRPVPVADARASLGLGAGAVFASVGNLVAAKGHDLVIEAVATIPGATLVIVGDGPERQRLAERARALGVSQRVRFLAVRPQRDLAVVYSAVDALVLASTREGWPNVVLEAIACGTPVIATPVGGVPEIIANSVVGTIVDERSPLALASAMTRVLSTPPGRQALTDYAARFGWRETALGHLALCRQIAASHRVARSGCATVTSHGV